MTRVTLIGLHAAAGVGKTTLAEQVFMPLGFLPLHFGDHMKMELIARGAASFHDLYEIKAETDRRLMQQYAHEYGREALRPDIWVRALDGWLHYLVHYSPFRRFVIPDVRYANEVDYIHRRDGYVYHIEGPSYRPLTGEVAAHASEHQALNPEQAFDGVLYTDEPLEPQLQSLLRAHGVLSATGVGSG